MVRTLDLAADFANADGSLKKDLFTPDNIHLSPAGHDAYAARLKPLIEACCRQSGRSRPLPRQAPRPNHRPRGGSKSST
ncbi:SGNH/GDSL hydrolase family protein [Humisphaera borealis]|uniref:SGNH hydrolase-type esterase domain-containing protein n=1 Tax=Humisphaera borealis TaxID=2807512 RepID=A0A7M2WS51_9BACT|nr:hypothetical protein [Humisphaera borealis]QOV87621.1 hypothetical protein IPV69_15140 [Humisphaera borealis]